MTILVHQKGAPWRIVNISEEAALAPEFIVARWNGKKRPSTLDPGGYRKIGYFDSRRASLPVFKLTPCQSDRSA